jgi:hypothetical protein
MHTDWLPVAQVVRWWPATVTGMFSCMLAPFPPHSNTGNAGPQGAVGDTTAALTDKGGQHEREMQSTVGILVLPT